MARNRLSLTQLEVELGRGKLHTDTQITAATSMLRFLGKFFRKVRRFSPDYHRPVIEPVLRELLTFKIDYATVEYLHLAVLANPRYQNPKRLSSHGFKAYSQHEEDGLLDEIFRRIGTTNRFFVSLVLEMG